NMIYIEKKIKKIFKENKKNEGYAIYEITDFLTNIVEGNYDTTRTNKVTGYKVIETSYIPAKLSDYHEDSYKVGVEVYTEQHNINKAKNYFNKIESEIYDNYAVNVAGSVE